MVYEKKKVNFYQILTLKTKLGGDLKKRKILQLTNRNSCLTNIIF